MGLGDRFSEWVEERRQVWGDALGTWFLDRIASGLTKSFEDMEPGAIAAYREGLTELSKEELLPPGIKTVIDRALQEGNILTVIQGYFMLMITAVPSLLSSGQPLGNMINYKHEQLVHSYRFDPLSVINAWRRKPETWTGLFQDLKDRGFDDDRIQALKDITEFLPSADEQTLWLAREVFEPEMVRKYGLDDETPNYADTDFSKIGVSPEQMVNKWRAHWDHASYIQIIEMFRRGLITEQDFYEWFKLVEIGPFWRDNLIEISKAWPTRVDVRRWWDMRTIDEPELRRLYAGMGYDGVNLDNYITWTKVYTEFPSLLARWSKGWITTDELRSRTIALGMPAARVETFIREKIEADQPERTSAERDITKTDIYKGVKQERITRDQGLELLQDLGYDPDEADYLLAINIPEDEVESVAANRLLTKADVLAGLRTDVLTEAQAKERLLGLRYSAVDTQLLLDIFKASISPPEEPRQREASKADIVKAVKKGLITPEEGYLMLIDIGFEPTAADFILFVNVEESPFSPVSFEEFKNITGKWRRATGMTTRAEDDRLREAGDELVRITDQIKLLEDQEKVEERLLVDPDTAPDEALSRLDEITVALNRARSERNRLQRDFDTLAAEFTQKNQD